MFWSYIPPKVVDSKEAYDGEVEAIGEQSSNKSNRVTGVAPCVTTVTKPLARNDGTEERHSEGA